MSDELSNEEIDFSYILKQSFQAPLEADKDWSKENLLNQSEGDESLAARNIVIDAHQVPRSLFCPFCCAEYLFEFTLKDHLERFHTKQIKQNLRELRNKDPESGLKDMEIHHCSFCHAVFYYIGLLPKHIAAEHGREALDEWRDRNLEKLEIERENEPSINYVNCSPGLSLLFDDLDTCDSVRKLRRSESAKTLNSTPKIRSILKKTNNLSEKIIFSSASASLKRSKGEMVKRSTSVRRELRFDLPPLPKSPEEPVPEENKTATKRKFFDWMHLRGKEKQKPQMVDGVSPTKIVKKNIKVKSCKLVAKTLANQQQLFVTSTPNNGLDDFLGDMNEDSIDGNWKLAIQSQFKPSFFSTERFQCNQCKSKKTFFSNEELLHHLKENHSKISLKPNYRCSTCGSKYYRNLQLVRHCTMQHTPVKK